MQYAFSIRAKAEQAVTRLFQVFA